MSELFLPLEREIFECLESFPGTGSPAFWSFRKYFWILLCTYKRKRTKEISWSVDCKNNSKKMTSTINNLIIAVGKSRRRILICDPFSKKSPFYENFIPTNSFKITLMVNIRNFITIPFFVWISYLNRRPVSKGCSDFLPPFHLNIFRGKIE